MQSKKTKNVENVTVFQMQFKLGEFNVIDDSFFFQRERCLTWD